MSSLYHPAQRALQDRFDSRRLADRLEQVKVHAALTDADRAFITSRDMFFLATVGPDGWPTCSYIGGDPGFVRVVDGRTIAFPVYDGNGMFLSLGNVAATGKVGLLFLDLESPRRLRLEGAAVFSAADPLLAEYPEALGIVRVTIARVYPNCPRYIHRYHLVERSRYVPQAGRETPVPEWKRNEWARDVLPEHGGRGPHG